MPSMCCLHTHKLCNSLEIVIAKEPPSIIPSISARLCVSDHLFGINLRSAPQPLVPVLLLRLRAERLHSAAPSLLFLFASGLASVCQHFRMGLPRGSIRLHFLSPR